VPVRGNLKDPQFNFGRVILQVFMNILSKAATAPFALLGSIVGGGEDLSYVEFPPGAAQMQLKDTKKLDSLARALKQRPQLKLRVAGSFDAQDRLAFARVIFREGPKAKDLAKRATEIVSERAQREYAQRIKDAFPKAAGLPEEDPEKRRARLASKQLTRPLHPYEDGSKPGSKPTQFIVKDTPFEQMERQVLESVQVPEGELQALAAERAKFAQDYLVKTAGLPPERVTIAPPDPKAENQKPRSGVNLLLQ
jgi:hypothetical protein